MIGESINLIKRSTCLLNGNHFFHICITMTQQSGHFKNYWHYVKSTQRNPVSTYIYRKYWKHNMVRIKLVIKRNNLIKLITGKNDITSPNQIA